MTRAFPKPSEREGKIVLTKAQERKKLDELCAKQNNCCARCGIIMVRGVDSLNTATLDHIKPEPAGCKKRGNDSNLEALCWLCNTQKGSKR